MRSFVVCSFLFVGLAGATSAQTAPLVERQALDRYLASAEWGGRLTPTTPGLVGQPPEAEVGTVTGMVTDEGTGGPLAAVQISLVGTGLGGLSGDDGRFLILNVPDGAHTLRAERIGYQTGTAAITVASGATVVQNFAMSLQALAMDAIVVTGVPGGTRRRAIGNAVGSVDASALTGAAPMGDVQSLLRGRTPSVNMMGGGQVGVAPRMRIRGASTFSLDGQPLVYIDGVRVNNEETTGYTFGNNAGVRGMLTSLDPEQIERIEVLKGPAAATLYGTEASRGVVNIITKRGNEGGVKVDMMVRQGVNYMGNPGSKVGYDNYWTDPASGQITSLNMVQHYKDGGRDVFGYGPVQTYSANLSGGSEDTQYFFSSTYSREVGLLNHNFAKKLNLRTNLDTRLSDEVGLTMSLGYTNSSDRLATDGFSSILEGMEFGSPRFLAENRCRTNPGFGCDVFDGVPVVGVPARDKSLINTQDLDRFTGSVTFNYTPATWLTARLTTGVDYTGELDVAFREFQTNDTTIASLGANGAKGFRNEGRYSYFLTTSDFSSTANFDLTSGLASSSSVGMQYYTRTISFLTATGQQFAGPGLSTITSTSIPGVPDNNRISDNTLGFYVQETLGWRDRLFLTGAVRVDNNSAFGSDIDLVTYPKASLSWVMNEEGWFENVAPSFVDGFRLRLAWGESGEQPASFSALRTWSPVTGPNSTAGVTPNTVGNPDLTAEVGQETEVGFDADLFENRLGLQFTYYHKLTKGAILERDLPPSGGFTGQQFVNAGRIVNDGVELGLNARVLQRQGLSWDLGFNYAYNSAKILQLSGEPGDTTIVFNSWSSMEHRVGHAPFSWFGVDVVSASLDANGNTVNALCNDGMGGTTPCFNASGQTIAPRVDLGRAIAPHEFSLSTGLSIGDNLSFHALFTSEQGHKRFDNTLRQRCRLYNVCRTNAFPNEWDPIMKATVESSDQIIDSWVNDVGFIRLKEVSLSYNLPQNMIRGFGMSRAVWQIAGRNLFTSTDWTASDPEVMFSSGGRAFMAQNNLPLPQQIVTTIRFSF